MAETIPKQSAPINRRGLNENSFDVKRHQGEERNAEANKKDHRDCLQILRGEGDTQSKSAVSYKLNDRPQSAGSARRAPPVQRCSDLATRLRHPPTPTRRVELQAVKRKENAFGSDADLKASTAPVTLSKSETMLETCEAASAVNKESSRERKAIGNKKKESSREREAIGNKNASNNNVERRLSNLRVLEGRDVGGVDNEKSSGGEEESDSEESGGSEVEPTKAPNELLIEFLGYVMRKDFVNAKKLCQMILLYEPNNEQALGFRSAIEERLFYDEALVDEDPKAESSSTEESNSDDEEDESSDESTSEESDEDDGDGEENEKR